MAQRRRRQVLIEVGNAGEDGPPVGDVGDGGQGVAANPSQLERAGEGGGVEGDAEEHEEERREKAPGAAAPKGDESDASVSSPLGEKEAGNEEAAEDEEGVDAEEAAAGPGHVGVVGENSGDGQRADAIERRLIGEAAVAFG